MQNTQAMGLTLGTAVRFSGGLGRGGKDDPYAKEHVGIVNGPPTYGPPVYVPVHVRESNHNMVVAAPNIIAVAG